MYAFAPIPEERMRLVYTADLHGDIRSYRSLLDFAVETGARAAIVGGDLLPHAIKLSDALQVQRSFVERQLRPLLEQFRAEHPNVAVYLLAGNDDWAAAIAALDALEADGLAHPLHERVYRLGANTREVGQSTHADGQALWLAGYACVPLTPFSIKDYERRDDGPLPPFSFRMAYTSWGGAIERMEPQAIADRPSITDDLAVLAARSDPARTIYVCHTPPADTPLDQMPNQRHVGSRALRAFVERHAPPLTLHGHIHEAPQQSGRYATQIGATWCVNPGHEPHRFAAVMLDTEDIGGTIEHTIYGRPYQ
ncbi:MAG TPA: metallophosphoesterase [Roseiflexaceae bacterium]|nr:metallophosphoesterase [Roseiflexaceae bacterium]